MQTQTIGSISISAEAILDLHSLNNEGGEGNQIQTRMVEVVVRDPETQELRVETVNAISGDMFKHIQAEHLFGLAQQNLTLPLCDGCKRFNSNRISIDPDFRSFIAGKPGATAVLERILTSCVIDDLEGILITEGNQSVARKSVVEFGWVVGRPDTTRTGQFFHVKYNPEQREQEEDRSGNQGQAIFYRPASSGVYAIVCNLELARIGYNNINQGYSISEDQRLERHKALIQSVLYTFIRPAGAMRSTQHPHLVDIRGVVSWSTNTTPAPTLSALNPNFVEESQRICAALNPDPNNPQIHQEVFNGFAELSEILMKLSTTTSPLRLGVAREG
jgi:CRISPR-associated protein Cst2